MGLAGDSHNVIVGIALAYGGFSQILAGMWEFVTGNTFGATAFTSYGAFWIAFGYISVPSSGILAAYTDEKEKDIALGCFLLGWTIFTCILTLATLKTTKVFITLFVSLTITFIFLAMGHFVNVASPSSGQIVTQIGGALGVWTACLAWYCAASALITKETSYFELPMFPVEVAAIELQDVEKR
ncbi:hypothetical protein HDU98_005838 [Podochytrium sp. JEL0797]|nr:hypothetical protein HDU98_005838 [Podochytrium sp. JEL0797]